MQKPLEVTFRDVERTDDLIDLIENEVEKLEKVHHNLIGGNLAVEKPHKHANSGSPYRVRLEIEAPGSPEIVVIRKPRNGKMHEDLPVVIREVFSKTRRRLKKVVEKQRGETKVHPQQQAGAVVSKLFPEEGYGFLRTVEGREIFFHKNSVLHDDFDRLEIGTGVSFAEEMGQKGLQASTVRIEDKPGSRMGPQGKTELGEFEPEE